MQILGIIILGLTVALASFRKPIQGIIIGSSEDPHGFTSYDYPHTKQLTNKVPHKNSQQGFQNGDRISHITLTKQVPYPVPHPVPYPVYERITYPVKVPVPIKIDQPYEVKVYKPYPVRVDKPVPYQVIKNVPIPVKVPVNVPVAVKIPVLVPQPYPVEITKTVPVQVPETIVVKKPVLVYIQGDGVKGESDITEEDEHRYQIPTIDRGVDRGHSNIKHTNINVTFETNPISRSAVKAGGFLAGNLGDVNQRPIQEGPNREIVREPTNLLNNRGEGNVSSVNVDARRGTTVQVPLESGRINAQYKTIANYVSNTETNLMTVARKEDGSRDQGAKINVGRTETPIENYSKSQAVVTPKSNLRSDYIKRDSSMFKGKEFTGLGAYATDQDVDSSRH